MIAFLPFGFISEDTHPRTLIARNVTYIASDYIEARSYG